ncbi:14.7 kDa ribonuclease H-like protein [Telopea speciosissima]|uniref:14.7 kDa ribonuclease H-like protein n=1 Tax=Telopea speciosissima TaxID=54955 RepID=UPI001CC59410|nr:14.7 kDa ribonuclease H-like protein [Telopea speciosissima]
MDGASKGNPGLSGGGGIICNQEGNLVLAFSNFYGHCTNTESEMRAVLDGLRVCASKGLAGCHVALDSKSIVKFISSRICKVWCCWYWFDEVLRLVDALGATVMFSYREGNRAADFLANRAHEVQGNNEFLTFGELPPDLYRIIREDKAGLPVFCLEGESFYLPSSL